MTNHRFLPGMFLFVAVFASLAYADNADKSSAAADISAIKVEPGKQYIYKESGGKPQALEVYFPPDWKATDKRPGMMMFHGGGWSGGDLRQLRYQCKYFANRGLVAATADYQMLPRSEKSAIKPAGAYMRACVTDGKSAIRWMKQHAAELGVDPNRIIVGGSSAGGHVAVLATLTPGLNDPQDPKGIDTKVVAYVLFNPAFYPTGPRMADDEVNIFKQLKPDLAPAIFFHGTKDSWLPDGSAQVVKQLKALGNKDVEMWFAPDQVHGFFNKEPWVDLTLAEADRFLVKHGLLKGKSPLTPPATGEKLVKVP